MWLYNPLYAVQCREEADGTVVFELPMAADDMLTAFDVDDTGAAVLNALDHPHDWDVSAPSAACIATCNAAAAMAGAFALSGLYWKTKWIACAVGADCGEYMCLAGYHAPLHQYVSDFHRVTGRPARLHTTEKAASDEWTQMFRWFSQHTYFGCHDISNARRCNPHLKTWRQWLQESGWKGPQGVEEGEGKGEATGEVKGEGEVESEARGGRKEVGGGAKEVEHGGEAPPKAHVAGA
ncbi:unnamed protein product [Closterium sp. NIES-65]|nr:unnamed protein product [Closterium sp. NIES-65]